MPKQTRTDKLLILVFSLYSFHSILIDFVHFLTCIAFQCNRDSTKRCKIIIFNSIKDLIEKIKNKFMVFVSFAKETNTINLFFIFSIKSFIELKIIILHLLVESRLHWNAMHVKKWTKSINIEWKEYSENTKINNLSVLVCFGIDDVPSQGS